MGNKVMSMVAISDNDTRIEIKIYTTDFGVEIHFSENMRRTFEGTIITGSGIKYVETSYIHEPFFPPPKKN